MGPIPKPKWDPKSRAGATARAARGHGAPPGGGVRGFLRSRRNVIMDRSARAALCRWRSTHPRTHAPARVGCMLVGSHPYRHAGLARMSALPCMLPSVPVLRYWLGLVRKYYRQQGTRWRIVLSSQQRPPPGRCEGTTADDMRPHNGSTGVTPATCRDLIGARARALRRSPASDVPSGAIAPHHPAVRPTCERGEREGMAIRPACGQRLPERDPCGHAVHRPPTYRVAMRLALMARRPPVATRGPT